MDIQRSAIPLSVALLCGCATVSPYTPQQTAAFAEAVKLDNLTPTPQAVTLTQPLPLPGQLRPRPNADPKAKGERIPPHRVIDEANRRARQKPDPDGYYNAMMRYDYDPGALYVVYASPLNLTDIELEPGEKVITKPGIGDSVRWKAALSTSVQDGESRQHILITPTRPGISTTLMIPTDRRSYHIELHAYKTTYMASVAWNYPENTLAHFKQAVLDNERENALVRTGKVDIARANFDYTITVTEGKPSWTPVRAFDDGRKTYLQFPSILAVRDAPALYVNKYGEQQIVNYRQKELYYIVDGVFQRLELRVGSREEMQVVHIANNNA